MGRYGKWFLLLVAAVGAFVVYSYVGARFTAGKLVGPDPPVWNRTIRFEFAGVPELPGKPRAWVITYTGSRLPGVRRVQIYVSPTGELLATRPRDLDLRLDAWERAKLPH